MVRWYFFSLVVMTVASLPVTLLDSAVVSASSGQQLDVNWSGLHRCLLPLDTTWLFGHRLEVWRMWLLLYNVVWQCDVVGNAYGAPLQHGLGVTFLKMAMRRQCHSHWVSIGLSGEISPSVGVIYRLRYDKVYGLTGVREWMIHSHKVPHYHIFFSQRRHPHLERCPIRALDFIHPEASELTPPTYILYRTLLCRAALQNLHTVLLL